MRADASFAVPVKLWALLCVFAGVTIGGKDVYKRQIKRCAYRRWCSYCSRNYCE